MAAAVRDPDPVIFFEHKSLYATKGEVPDGEIVDTLGTAKILRPGKDATILALALMVPRALEAAEKLKAEHGIDCEVVDVRSLVPLDTQTILGSVAQTAPAVYRRGESAALRLGRRDRLHRRRRGFYDLDGPPVRITTPHIPLPAADTLEDLALPTAGPDRRARVRSVLAPRGDDLLHALRCGPSLSRWARIARIVHGRSAFGLRRRHVGPYRQA